MKQKPKMSVFIRSNTEESVDMDKVKQIVTSHGIQVTRATVNDKSGDIYVDFPSEENRNKFIPLLSDETVNVVSLKEKSPSISIRGINDYTTENELIEKVKTLL